MDKGPIINRVAQSSLQVFDMELDYPKGTRSFIDLSPWLFEGLILKEKEFRKKLDSVDWIQYQDHFVAMDCTTDAILPTWAFMLVASKLHGVAQLCVKGDLDFLERQIALDHFKNLDVSKYAGKPVIIKGCSRIKIPGNIYVQAVGKIQSVAKSVMFGEACSAVPIYKRK